ncbi:roadblock/LC7 domain-containing protein [Thermopolyspora sp. NPDC052614]|uniref:roadblock/LC7 domain-containing protein n=1 Tax=Thermopolyspora sp. NPDC052614 TaxID=3155682 RepID=UPI003433BFF3
MSTNDEELADEIRRLRDRVVGVTDVAVATTDGILITADADADLVNPDTLAALSAATLGLARRAGDVLGRGGLQQTVAQFNHGYVVVQAVGELALMAVLGDAGMDVRHLHRESQAVTERINHLLTAPQEPAKRA